MAAGREGVTSDSAPSLLEARATGGVYGGRGFTVQDRYLARCIATWLADPRFERVQPERAEDIDVWFVDGLRDHHQVKDEQLTEGNVRDLVSEFRTTFKKALDEDRIGRYVIACGRLAKGLQGFVNGLDRYRQSHFGPNDADERQRTEATLRATAKRLKLADQFDFIVERVYFDQALVGLDSTTGEDRWLLAARLREVLPIKTFDEGGAVADGLMRVLAQDRTRARSRVEIEQLLATELRLYREGPAQPSGDLVLLRHETLKRVDLDPAPDDHRELFGQRRVVRLCIDAVDRVNGLDPASISEVAHELARVGGPYREVLGRSDSRILYYGFPHVPFGVLAGYLAQGHRQIALVEHDLEAGTFSWRPGATTTPPKVSTLPGAGRGTAARARVSVSALVREEACETVLPADEMCVDIHVEADEIGRGHVVSEAQAREIAARFRRALDSEISGNPMVSAIHVFAAVPVSVAFCVGQALAHSSMPRSYVYNFDAAAKPAYCWRLGLREACASEPCVEVYGRS